MSTEFNEAIERLLLETTNFDVFRGSTPPEFPRSPSSPDLSSAPPSAGPSPMVTMADVSQPLSAFQSPPPPQSRTTTTTSQLALNVMTCPPSLSLDHTLLEYPSEWMLPPSGAAGPAMRPRAISPPSSHPSMTSPIATRPPLFSPGSVPRRVRRRPTPTRTTLPASPSPNGPTGPGDKWITREPLELDDADFEVPVATIEALRTGNAGLADLDSLRDEWLQGRKLQRRKLYYDRLNHTAGLTPATKVKVRGRINSMLKKFIIEESSVADAIIKRVLAQALISVRKAQL